MSVAAELGVADLLAHGPRTTAQLATSAGVDAEKLFRLLRFLASRGVFQEDAHGKWRLTPLADLAFPDGMERSENQFHTIFNASGFTVTGITPTASPVSVIEARPV